MKLNKLFKRARLVKRRLAYLKKYEILLVYRKCQTEVITDNTVQQVSKSSYKIVCEEVFFP